MSPQTPVFDPSRTALLVMHYQTDIMELFPSVAPALLSNTRQLCDAARHARAWRSTSPRSISAPATRKSAP